MWRLCHCRPLPKALDFSRIEFSCDPQSAVRPITSLCDNGEFQRVACVEESFMKRHHLLVILCIVSTCLSVGIPLPAQDNVEVTVSATSADNAPLLTLGKPDFTVQDSGKPRAITTFVGPQAKPAAPPPLQPNEFSNLPDFREASGAIFVVLDTIDTRYLDERDERPLILKFLGKAAQAKHAVTLGILSDKGLHLYHDYRTGSDVLLAALIKAGLGGMKGATSSIRCQRR